MTHQNLSLGMCWKQFLATLRPNCLTCTVSNNLDLCNVFNVFNVFNINVPGGHTIHPFSPSEEELVKVPNGHGRKQPIDLLLAIRLNPEAKSASTKVFDPALSGDVTSIASFSEL